MSSCSDIDRRVGARVRALRKKSGLSQAKLGRILGVSFQQVQKYENGTNRIGASKLVLIAEALNVHPTFFFEEQIEALNLATALGPLHEDLRDLVSAFQHIPEAHVRKSVIDIVRLLAAAKR